MWTYIQSVNLQKVKKVIKFKVVTDWKTLTYNETRHEDTEEVLVASWRFKPYIPWRGWNVRAELWSYLDQWQEVTGFGDIQSMQKSLNNIKYSIRHQPYSEVN